MTRIDAGLASEPIRIGVLYSRSGTTSAAELTQLQATMLAVEEINRAGGVSGREIELVCLDPQCQPWRYADLAEQLILEHRVRVIVGCYMSSTRKAVIPIVERHNALLFYATPYEGFEYSRNVIYTGAAPNQNTLPLAGFMLTQFGSRVSMIGSDYVCPYESNRVMSDLILERGGEKVDETYLSLDAPWESYLDAARRIKQLAPDFIFSTVVGEGIPHLYRAFAQVGLDPYRTPIASHMTSEAEIALMGNDLAEGTSPLPPTSRVWIQPQTSAPLPAIRPASATISRPTCAGKLLFPDASARGCDPPRRLGRPHLVAACVARTRIRRSTRPRPH